MPRLIVILLIISSPAIADDVMYVQSTNAKMFQDKSFTSPLITELSRGIKITVISTSGRWVQASFEKKKGWISSLLLSKNPPLEKVTVINDDAELGNNVRRRASVIATAGATRGLTTDNRQRASDDETANHRALLQIEQAKVSDAELMQFREMIIK